MQILPVFYIYTCNEFLCTCVLLLTFIFFFILYAFFIIRILRSITPSVVFSWYNWALVCDHVEAPWLSTGRVQDSSIFILEFIAIVCFCIPFLINSSSSRPSFLSYSSLYLVYSLKIPVDPSTVFHISFYYVTIVLFFPCFTCCS